MFFLKEGLVDIEFVTKHKEHTSLFERLINSKTQPSNTAGCCSFDVEGHTFKANFTYSKSRDLANIGEARNRCWLYYTHWSSSCVIAGLKLLLAWERSVG